MTETSLMTRSSRVRQGVHKSPDWLWDLVSYSTFIGQSAFRSAQKHYNNCFCRLPRVDGQGCLTDRALVDRV